MNLDPFLTALYTIVNDFYRQHAAAPSGPKAHSLRQRSPHPGSLRLVARHLRAGIPALCLPKPAAKLSALNPGIRLNRYYGCLDLPFATLFSC